MLSFRNLHIKELRYKIGLSLSIIGVTIGMLLNYFLPVVTWSPIIMFLSVLLLLNGKILRLKPKLNRFFTAIIFFQLFMIICSILSDYSEPVFYTYLFYHLYIIALAVVMIKNVELRTVNFLSTLFWLSSFVTIIAAVIAYFDLARLDIQMRRGEAVLELFTLNIASYANLIAGLCLIRGKTALYKLAIFIFMLIDFYVIVRSGKRSFFAAVFMSIFVYLYKYHCVIKGLLAGLAFVTFTFVAIPQVRMVTMEMVTRSVEGFRTVFASKSKAYDYDEYDSATIRKYNKQVVYDDLENNFGLLNVFVGMGYYYAYIDNPLLESYLDMGVIGFFYYVYLIIVIPFLFFKKIRGDDELSMFILLNTILNLTVIVTNYNPYQYFVYTPICLVAMRYYELPRKSWQLTI